MGFWATLTSWYLVVFLLKKKSKHEFVKFESIVLANYTVQIENGSFGKVVLVHRTGSSETGLTVGPLFDPSWYVNSNFRPSWLGPFCKGLLGAADYAAHQQTGRCQTHSIFRSGKSSAMFLLDTDLTLHSRITFLSLTIVHTCYLSFL